jgi:hypothetical protein
VTECPTRFLRRRPDISAFVEWFLWSMERDPWSGRPIGVREWPQPGGVLAQPAKLVQAVDLLMKEWPYLETPKSEPQGKASSKGH